MRTCLALLAVLFLAAALPACAPLTPDALTPAPPRTDEPKPGPAAAQSHTPTAASTASPVAAKPTAVTKATATITRAASNPTRQTLTLKVTSPLDESVVNVNPITVAGQTIPGAVISVNGDLAVVDAAGKFRMTVNLDEGPNILEIVASDESDSELSATLRLIYEP